MPIFERLLQAGFYQSVTPTELAEVNDSLKPAWSRLQEPKSTPNLQLLLARGGDTLDGMKGQTYYTSQQCLRILLTCFRNSMSAPSLPHHNAIQMQNSITQETRWSDAAGPLRPKQEQLVLQEVAAAQQHPHRREEDEVPGPQVLLSGIGFSIDRKKYTQFRLYGLRIYGLFGQFSLIWSMINHILVIHLSDLFWLYCLFESADVDSYDLLDSS